VEIILPVTAADLQRQVFRPGLEQEGPSSFELGLFRFGLAGTYFHVLVQLDERSLPPADPVPW
jgi:hypothetical protein